MVRCEYNQICETAKNYRKKINEFNNKRDYDSKKVEWDLYWDRCTNDYDNCLTRKSFLEAEN